MALANCAVEFDPENIQLWIKRLKAFHHSPQLLNSKNVGGIYRKKYILFSKCNSSSFKNRYQTNCQALITVFILLWPLLNHWKCYPRENHTLERNTTRTFPEILHFGELYYTNFYFEKYSGKANTFNHASKLMVMHWLRPQCSSTCSNSTMKNLSFVLLRFDQRILCSKSLKVH